MYFSGQHGAPTIDAIGHIGRDLKLFGGVDAVTATSTPGGIGANLGIEAFPADLMVNRAVLLDVARHVASGRPDPLPTGFEITARHLDETMKAQGVDVQRGDSLLIRTGWGPYFGTDNAKYLGEQSPGPGQDAARWIIARGVRLAGDDTATFEKRPAAYGKELFSVHMMLLADNGIYIVENANLEPLSAARAHVVGDEEHGLVTALPHVEQQLLHHQTRLGVERAEGLVHQQHLRLHHEHARDAHALLHSAGELRRVVGREAFEPHLREQRVDPGPVHLGRHAPRLRAERDVVEHGVPGEEGGLLEDDGAARVRALDGRAVRPPLAGGGPVEAGPHVEERGLAAARGAEDRGELVGRHREVDRPHRLDPAPALDELLPDVAELGGQTRRGARALSHAPRARAT